MSLLELDHVTRVFGRGELAVTAVDDVSIQIEKGELIIVMGPSGSGKTTLLQILGALLTPTSGEVRIDGFPLSDRDSGELARLRLSEIGFIFQGFNLFSSLTALENAALPAALAGVSKRDRMRDATRLLGRLGLGHRLHHLPEELSGGEKQRVAIARAMINDPPLILADEPTANLDSSSGYQVLHLLQDIVGEENKTVVIVTHDHRMTDAADRMLWLQDGSLRDRATDFETAADPVCGMEIVVERAAASRVAGQDLYYFCSQICVDKFDSAPQHYQPPGTKGEPT